MNNQYNAMTNTSRARSLFACLLALSLSTGVIATLPSIVSAAASPTCTFTRDMGFGTDGNDVKCLQQFLNSTGFTISAVGAGSSGKETTTFRAKMKDAVTLWQIANGLMPATGNFGAKSRAKYKEIIAAPTAPSSVIPSSTTVITPAGSENTGSPAATQASITSLSAELKARQSIDKVRQKIADLTSTIKKARSNKKNVDDAAEFLASAKGVMYDALLKYIDKKYSDVQSLVDEANNYLLDAEGDVKSNKKRDGLTYARAIVFNNDTVVRIKLDGEEYVFSTRKEDKDGIILAALDEVDSDRLDKTELKDLLELDSEDRDSTSADKKMSKDDPETAANEAIDTADKYVSDARDDLSDTDAEGDDLDEAKDLITKARSNLKKAKAALDDEDFDEAVDRADQATEDAKDAIKLLK